MHYIPEQEVINSENELCKYLSKIIAKLRNNKEQVTEEEKEFLKSNIKNLINAHEQEKNLEIPQSAN